MCKGPQVGKCLACTRNSKINVAGASDQAGRNRECPRQGAMQALVKSLDFTLSAKGKATELSS